MKDLDIEKNCDLGHAGTQREKKLQGPTGEGSTQLYIHWFGGRFCAYQDARGKEAAAANTGDVERNLQVEGEKTNISTIGVI